MITPAIRATLPAFQLVQDRERILESDSSQSSSPEADNFVLAPRTYSPGPPFPRLDQVKQPDPPAPEISKRSSLRKRFSLGSGKKKDISGETALRPPPPRSTPRAQDTRWGPRERVYSVTETQSRRTPSSSIPEHAPAHATAVPTPSRDIFVATPPSRGLDSAYCSDFEKPPSTPATRMPASPILTRDFSTPSPRSDLSRTSQYYRPVNASPNSPLQRPWTAAPSDHIHTSSNLSGLSKLSNGSQSRLQLSHQNTSSQPGLREQLQSRAATERGVGAERGEYARGKSRMGMSTVSDMTMITENGTKVKKKRSAFGWFKKAFALSEEEKMAFGERRRQKADFEQDSYQQRPQQRWLDGKRIR
jgi:hypothetical protein